RRLCPGDGSHGRAPRCDAAARRRHAPPPARADGGGSRALAARGGDEGRGRAERLSKAPLYVLPSRDRYQPRRHVEERGQHHALSRSDPSTASAAWGSRTIRNRGGTDAERVRGAARRLRSASRASSRQRMASGSSTKAASLIETTSSGRLDEVSTSNQASANKSVAVAVAAPSSQGERRQAATATVSKSIANATSKPTQAISQCAARCSDGNAAPSRTTHGTRNSAASPNNVTTQTGGRRPACLVTASPKRSKNVSFHYSMMRLGRQFPRPGTASTPASRSAFRT